EYEGNLNNDGEQLIITNSDGINIINVQFNDGDEWPSSADGDGFSLIKINPQKNILNSGPNTWRSSAAIGGNPGYSDTLSLQEWSTANNVNDPLLDTDNDMLSALSEYAIGTDPNKVSASSELSVRVVELEVEGLTDNYFIIDVKRRVGADDVNIHLQSSNNLINWNDLIAPLSVINSENNGNGTETISYLAGKTKEFTENIYFRGMVSLIP
ncbi:MAG: hypothetical protein VYC70_07635, partial [Verrucomicrobiota bacterium]|nr:hypothetical protein [Verrucomicrobiota bacterium]